MTHTGLVRLAAAGSFFFAAGHANAQSMEDAEAAFADGRFVEAAEIAEAVGTASSYALAARSLAVHGHYVAAEEEQVGFYERAMQLGEMAVAADSTSAEAHYRYAQAVGRYAQTAGILTALTQGLGGKARDLLETAARLDPDFGPTHMALGSWHASVADAGWVPRRMYGASWEDAAEHFERAMELDPDSKFVRLEYAVWLPDLDEDNGVERALAMLEEALDLPVRDAYEELVHLSLLDAIDFVKSK